MSESVNAKLGSDPTHRPVRKHRSNSDSSLRYLVHLTEEQILGVREVSRVSSEVPPLLTVWHFFPSMRRVTGEQPLSDLSSFR